MIKKNPEQSKIDEYAAFDVLRFALASIVVLYHSGEFSWSQSGNLAVQMFFALSGWLIGGILCDTRARELSRFYFNRSSRVWIPYFVTVAALYLTSEFHETVHSSRWWEFFTYDVTFTHNWFSLWPDAQRALAAMPLLGTGNHFWSIAVEEQFYLFAPLIITLLPFGRKIGVWACIAAISYLLRTEYASISLGVLCAVVAHEHVNWHLKMPARIGQALVLAGSGVAMAVTPFYSFAAPFFSVCVVLLCAHPLKRNAVTRWIGGISFPFYLNAWIGAFILHAVTKRFGVAASGHSIALEYLAGATAAVASYHLVDAQVMAHRNQHYSRALGWCLGIVGYCLVISGLVYWIQLYQF